MRRRADGWSLVIAGLWNRSIFLPDWVLPRLFPRFTEEGHNVETEVALLPFLPLIYRDPQVTMEVASGRLVFKPRILDDECLLRCEEMARSMLLELPQTPTQAIGINFGFRQSEPPTDLLAILRGHGDERLEATGWVIGDRKLVRKLAFVDDTLNLTLTSYQDGIDFDFNFNSETTANEEAIRALEVGRTIRLRDAAYTIIREAYQLEIEGDDVGNGD